MLPFSLSSINTTTIPRECVPSLISLRRSTGSGGSGPQGHQGVRRHLPRGPPGVGHVRGGCRGRQQHRHTGHPRRGLRREFLSFPLFRNFCGLFRAMCFPSRPPPRCFDRAVFWVEFVLAFNRGPPRHRDRRPIRRQVLAAPLVLVLSMCATALFVVEHMGCFTNVLCSI